MTGLPEGSVCYDEDQWEQKPGRFCETGHMCDWCDHFTSPHVGLFLMYHIMRYKRCCRNILTQYMPWMT